MDDNLPDRVTQAVNEAAHSGGASDVHIVNGQPPWVRFGSVFEPKRDYGVVTNDEATACAQWANSCVESSIGKTVDGVRWRVTTYPSEDGWVTNFRIIPDVVPPFSELGLNEEVRGLAALRDGLVITAGSTGSGKTTTLAAIIQLIITSRPVRLMTIEDPVEYLHKSSTALVSHRELSEDLDGKTALATAMRADPDVLLFGEMRRPSDMELCLELAASGHLVLTTIHATDSATVCERIASNTGQIGRSMLAQTLKASITQRLIPSKHDPKVRHLAAEVMLVDHTLRNHIRPGGDLSRIEPTLLDDRKGMDIALADLVRADHVSSVDALAAANDKRYLERDLAT